jgi:DNA-binding NarL/FixJ family response regulator
MESIRVLIVDDQLHVRQGLAIMLNLASGKARPRIEIIGEAQNGYEAIERIQTLHPDVVLMDLEMPGMDGYEATRRIKAEHPALRVVILTLHADPQAQQCARAAGADGFVVKGASYEIMLNAILKRDAKNHSFDLENGEKT